MVTKIIYFVFSIFLSMVGTKALAKDYDIAVKNADGVTIYYKYINDEKELEVTYKNKTTVSISASYSGSVVIPEEITYMGSTQKVTRIGSDAFHKCSDLTSITIPNSVTSIGNDTFYGCSGLTSVTIPNSVTSIGNSAFSHCTNLTSITIPNSVTSIGNGAFSYCRGLGSINVETDNHKYDSREYCNAIIETETNALIVGCRNTIIPNSVISIGEWAFSGCSGLTSATIPNSVTNIENGAFSGCTSLTSITIPNSVTNIGYSAFLHCTDLTSITIGNSVTSIGDDAFFECSSLISVTIPNSVTNIGEYAFSNCSSLTSVTIGNSVTSIRQGVFSLCSNLTFITIPNSVTSIKEYAFSGCSSLTSVTIPNSVMSIGEYAFDSWNLKEVISMIENPFNINIRTFSYNTFNNATLYVPAGTIDKYKATHGWREFVYIEEGSPSRIKDVNSDESMEYRRYTLDGRVIMNSHKGINIIQMDNGKTKKVIVK